MFRIKEMSSPGKKFNSLYLPGILKDDNFWKHHNLTIKEEFYVIMEKN